MSPDALEVVLKKLLQLYLLVVGEVLSVRTAQPPLAAGMKPVRSLFPATCGLATTGDPSALWQVAMPAWASLSLAVLFLAAVAMFCRWVDTTSLPTAESLMRWICA